MTAAAAPHDLLPRPPGGMVRGAALALTVHVVLLFALTTVVQWRASEPDAVTAELWSALPQVAAPRPVEPPPAPPPPPPVAAPPKAQPELPDPQIVIAREKAARDKAEREEQLAKDRQRREQEAEAKRREQAERDKKTAAEEQRLAQLRQRNLDRLMGQVGNTAAGTGTAAQDSGPSRSYAGKLVATIKPNIVFSDTISGNPAAEVEVRAGPSGTIIARRLVRSSGHKDWDEAVLRAIDRTGTLPRDTDGRVPPTIIVAFRPQE